MNHELLALMRARTEGNWEFLATAAGERSSVERTVRCLDGSTLPTDRFSSRTVVRQRIEALAAFDTSALARVASTWPLPQEFPGNGSSGIATRLTEAWAAALRHLPLSVQQKILRGDVPKAYNQERVALVTPAPCFVDWIEVIQFVRNAPSYAHLRATDRSTFPSLSPSAFWIDTLLDIPHGGRWSAFQTVRVLRGGVHHLSPEARMYLLELAEAAWSSFSGDSPIQLLFFELARSIDRGARVLDLATEQLIATLKKAESPQRLLQTAYVVADAGWTMP